MKGTTKIICRANPETKLILGSSKLLLCVIVVKVVPACVLHKLGYSRGVEKGNFVSVAAAMGMFSLTIRDAKSK